MPTTQLHHHYVLCGWHVRSALTLPELPPWSATATPVDADVVIEEERFRIAWTCTTRWSRG